MSNYFRTDELAHADVLCFLVVFSEDDSSKHPFVYTTGLIMQPHRWSPDLTTTEHLAQGSRRPSCGYRKVQLRG